MRLNCLFGTLATFAACTALNAAPAEYEASVQQPYVAQRAMQSIGIAPFACPDKLDCEALEKALITELAARTGLLIVQSKEVRDLMTQARVTNLKDHESRIIIGEGLSVDAFAYVKIQKAQVDTIAPPEHDKWKHLKRETSAKRASLELHVVARDGTSLAKVSGEAEVFDSIKGLASITTRLFSLMLERAWT